MWLWATGDDVTRDDLPVVPWVTTTTASVPEAMPAMTLMHSHLQMSRLSRCKLLHIAAASGAHTHTPRAGSNTCSAGHSRLVSLPEGSCDTGGGGSGGKVVRAYLGSWGMQVVGVAVAEVT